ncbi:hypothetical protein Avbf_11649 [Armadillidium vulgare]|nr:hypothetical protein Avbf_11649 [Armadillidium vulgare]
MKIYVKMLQGAEKLYEVNSHTTGAELKQKVAKDLNIDESSQRLVFKGKPVSGKPIHRIKYGFLASNFSWIEKTGNPFILIKIYICDNKEHHNKTNLD